MPKTSPESQNRPRILLAIKSLSAAAGGAEKVFCDLANGLSQRGYDVQVLSFDAPGTPSFYALNPQIRRIDLGIGNTARKSTGPEVWHRMRLLRQTALNERPDAVIAFMHSMFVPMSIALIGTGIPVIASEHTIPEHYKGKPLEFTMILASFPFFKTMTVVSEQVQKFYPAPFQKRIVPIANPLVIKAPGAVLNKEKIILNVGRLETSKDQETIIRAFARIANEYPGWRLRMIGEGPLRKEFENLIQSLKLQDLIALPGNIPDLSDEYSRAAFFVSASRYESLGMATLEALAYGLPVIGFADCPGTNTLVQDGQNGFLLAGPDRLERLANAMRSLINDEDLRTRLSSNAPQSLKGYNSQSVLDMWDGLIKKFI